MPNRNDFDQRYKNQYDRLNNAQKRAVEAIDGPVMVIAGPGTGKTTILTLRIANILKKTDTPASGILAVTFTDAGVKAIKTKLRELIGSRADEVRIHTFHSFAASVMAEFKEYFIHLDGFKQMTDIDAEAMIRKILESKAFESLRPFGNPDFYIGPILSAIRDAKKEASTPKMIKEFTEAEMKRIGLDESLISTRGESKGTLKAEGQRALERCAKTLIFADVYAAYEKKKKQEKLMDFDDLIFELIVALGQNALLLRLLQEKFLYLLVDEHQDTNDAQNFIIKMLGDFFDNPNIFIVGDEKQAIYRFQGASVENFLRFEKTWPNIEKINLEDNYRSHQHILDTTFKMIENNYTEGQYAHLRVPLKASGDEEERPIDLVEAADVSSGEEYLIEQLKSISKKEPEKTVALISKNNRDVERLIRLCEANGVAVSAERSIDIFSHPIGATFFALVGFLKDQTDIESLGKTIAVGLWGIAFSQATELLRDLRNGKFEAIEKNLPILAFIQKERLTDSPINFLVFAAEKSGFLNIVSRDPAYVEVWRAIVGLALGLCREGDIHDPSLLLDRLMEYKASSENKSVKISVGLSDAQVKVMTAHGSKGLEFDYVFIPYATEESWSSRARNSYFVLPVESKLGEADALRDLRRLFYVALTRARKHITIICPKEESDGKVLTALRLVAELDQSLVSTVTISKKAAAKDKPTLETTSVSIKNADRILDHAKNVILEKGLSVTALNHFLKCPSEFLYKSILKLPEAPSPSAEKGIAMHLAFDRVWRSKDKGIENIQSIIDKTVEESLKRSFLPSFEREAVCQELLEVSPAIANSLASHFALQGRIFTEHWCEAHYKNILLHGKLDAIVDTEDETLVFDYKTRGKMSANEIKGLTKNSNGNYFRQLVFYRLLIEEDVSFKNKNVIPSLVFIMPDSKGRCFIETLPIEKSDLEKVKSEIQRLLDAVWSGAILTDSCGEAKCEWCALKKLSICRPATDR
ncbi:MAG: ATP-dependent DNA helicase [Candidatus Pacebacteria bacterium]|nr:ATP-dependent DNA helicase [Candidatus Paceibacterota bacterium]